MNDRYPIGGNPDRVQNSAYELLRPFCLIGDKMQEIKNQEIFCDFSFAQKVQIFSEDYLKCSSFLTKTDDPKNTFTKKLYSKLISSSMLLEDFLDFHGAKNNKNWYFYRELAATVRHLSLGANFQKHISNRLDFYDLIDIGEFEKDES